MALALVFAGATSHVSVPGVPPASIDCTSEILNPSGTTTYERDAHGRVTSKTQRLINGDTRSVSYSYNAQGLLASTTYPGRQALQYLYDTTGQLTATEFSSYRYDAAGRIHGVTQSLWQPASTNAQDCTLNPPAAPPPPSNPPPGRTRPSPPS